MPSAARSCERVWMICDEVAARAGAATSAARTAPATRIRGTTDLKVARSTVLVSDVTCGYLAAAVLRALILALALVALSAAPAAAYRTRGRAWPRHMITY